MPRATPTQVITHRIELNQYERDLLKSHLQQSMVAKNLPNLIGAGGLLIAGVAFAYWVNALTDMFEDWSWPWETTEQTEAWRKAKADGTAPEYGDAGFWDSLWSLPIFQW